jgi:type III restriction enzyme
VAHGHNRPYVRLISVREDKGFCAKLEIDVLGKDGGTVSRKTVTGKPGDDLFVLSGEREMYQGYKLAGKDSAQDRESVEFENTEVVRPGQALGDVDEQLLKAAQIKRNIEAHLKKELRYHCQGIKVLSLFFIDEVKKYRGEDGRPGAYAEMFSAAYEELMTRPKFADLKSHFPQLTDQVHNGYFSQDKKGHYKNTKGDSQDVSWLSVFVVFSGSAKVTYATT